MKISVVTVCFNAARTIAHSIESFLEQDHPNKELLIVDGRSTDETLKIVRSFSSSDIRLVSEPDSGIYDAMNKGLRLYSGDAVGFLNADDAFHDSRALRDIDAALQDHDIAFGDLNMVTDHSTKRTRRVWRPGAYSRRAFELGWSAPHPTFYARRTVVDVVGEMRADYKISADYDFMIRALAVHGFRSRYIPRVLVDFQLGGTSTQNWRASLLGNLECRDARRRHLRRLPVDIALILRPARRLFQLR